MYIVPTVGPGPVAIVRIFSDTGAEETAGFTEPDVPPSAALAVGERAVLLGPADPTNFRFNIGFLSLGFATATQMTVTARSSDGTLLKSVSVGVGVLHQESAASFFRMDLEPNMSFTVEVMSGALIAYGVTADNRTNDMSFQLARRIGG